MSVSVSFHGRLEAIRCAESEGTRWLTITVRDGDGIEGKAEVSLWADTDAEWAMFNRIADAWATSRPANHYLESVEAAE
jgi:hypothetical protein